jgi:hypothetical protein
MADKFKPNIYPIMYWGLMYGLIAGLLVFGLYLLSSYLTLVWLPVFLAGVVWGGYRNYKKQKREAGHAGQPKPAVEEFKEAAKDIMGVTKEMISEQMEEAAARDAVKEEAVLTEDEGVEPAVGTILEDEAELELEEVPTEEQAPAVPPETIPQQQPERPQPAPPVRQEGADQQNRDEKTEQTGTDNSNKEPQV